MNEIWGKARWITQYIRKRGWAHAPHFRARFMVDELPETASCRIAGVGFFELFLNGRKVGDAVLTPDFTRYDKRVLAFEFEVSDYLQAGENVAEVVLGNGYFNAVDADVWASHGADWRSDPEFILHLEAAGRTLLESGKNFLCAIGPVTYNAIHTGERFDARKRLAPWRTGEEPDAAIWERVYLTNSPGGEITFFDAPPCRVVRTIHPVASWQLEDGRWMYDFGENVAGVTEIAVHGASGAVVTLEHGERLDEKRALDNAINAIYVHEPGFQTDSYTLAGDAQESWHPAFTYHGFQYVRVTIEGEATLDAVRALVIRSDFAETGTFQSSSADLDALLAMNRRSYESNFVGMPTDCPHREKLGWTGDAALAVHFGMDFYAPGDNYREYLASMRDCQRLSGQVPGIVPHGKHWQFGPVWDGALILIPQAVHCYTGDARIVKENFASGAKLMEYFESLSDGDLMEFGPGDWCHVEQARAISPEIDASAIWMLCAKAMAEMAPVAGHPEVANQYSRRAAEIRAAFNRKFYRGAGHYANDEMTALALALACGIAEETERAAVAKVLNEVVVANGYKVDFGIVGAKYTPRALAETGYFDTALRLVTQREYPGWGNWLARGATTFYERWNGDYSRNHVMFGDVGAWAMEYAGGLRPDPANPGFGHFFLTVPDTELLFFARLTHKLPQGEIAFGWRKEANALCVEGSIPDGTTALLTVPGQAPQELAAGKFHLQF